MHAIQLGRRAVHCCHSCHCVARPKHAGMDSCGFVPVDSLVRVMETQPTPEEVVDIVRTDDKARLSSTAFWALYCVGFGGGEAASAPCAYTPR